MYMINVLGLLTAVAVAASIHQMLIRILSTILNVCFTEKNPTNYYNHFPFPNIFLVIMCLRLLNNFGY